MNPHSSPLINYIAYMASQGYPLDYVKRCAVRNYRAQPHDAVLIDEIYHVYSPNK